MTRSLTTSEAIDAIHEILDRIPDHDLPQPTKVEQRDGFQVISFGPGALGYYIGSGTSHGEPAPTPHRRHSVEQLIDSEAADRIEQAHWNEPEPQLSKGA